MLEKKKEFKYVSRRSNSNLDKTDHCIGNIETK